MTNMQAVKFGQLPTREGGTPGLWLQRDHQSEALSSPSGHVSLPEDGKGHGFCSNNMVMSFSWCLSPSAIIRKTHGTSVASLCRERRGLALISADDVMKKHKVKVGRGSW